MNSEERIQGVYNSNSNAELAKRYQEWAQLYERDMSQDFDYQSPKLVADFLTKIVATDAKILDAGSGTGLVGKVLYSRGYQNLVAMDLSEGMLTEAGKKGIYVDMKVGIIGQPIDFPSDTFDAVVSAGVFTLGHAPASGFDELIRMTKPGGHIVFTLHSDLYERGEFPEKMAALEAGSEWSLLEVSDKFQSTPAGEPEVTIRVLVYRVN